MNNSILPWFKAIRPFTLLTGMAPILFVFVLSQGPVNTLSWVCCLSVVVIFQINANLINDLIDGVQGRDKSEDRLGPQRLIGSGLVTPHTLKIVIGCLFAVGILLGIYPIVQSYPQGLFIALFCLVAVFLYSTFFSQIAMGEMVAFLFFGPIAFIGTAKAIQSNVNVEYSLIPGLFAAALMALNNYRDQEEDFDKGKKTLFNLIPTFLRPGLLGVFILLPFTSLWLLELPLIFKIIFLSIGVGISLKAMTQNNLKLLNPLLGVISLTHISIVVVYALVDKYGI